MAVFLICVVYVGCGGNLEAPNLEGLSNHPTITTVMMATPTARAIVLAPPRVLMIHPVATAVPTVLPKSINTSGPSVVIGGVVFTAEIATTAVERKRGLSGRETMGPRKGMLFTSRFGVPPIIWMKGMLFELDLVWISERCVVVEITTDVPVPTKGMADSELPHYKVLSAVHIFEIGGGEAAKSGVNVGDEVRFVELEGEAEGLCE